MRHASLAALAVAAALNSLPVSAADFIIAFIDPLSGGAASAGVSAQKHLAYFSDKINAHGGLNGEKIVIHSYDNKVSPQESLIQLKKALDEGARIATITAVTELHTYGLTLWEFRPIVEENGVIGWKLLQTLARELRDAEHLLAER